MPQSTASNGLRIVRVLSAGLRARLAIEPTQGCSIRLTFPAQGEPLVDPR